MSRTAHPMARRQRTGERVSKRMERSNPLAPTVGTEAARAARQHSADTPNLESQRQALLALRARLRGNVAQTADTALGGHAIETTSASPDAAERASETFEQDLALSLLGNATGILEQVEAALERIEEGSYGLCAGCDNEIPAARLEAIPYAARCVECAARQERAGGAGRPFG